MSPEHASDGLQVTLGGSSTSTNRQEKRAPTSALFYLIIKHIEEVLARFLVMSIYSDLEFALRSTAKSSGFICLIRRMFLFQVFCTFS